MGVRHSFVTLAALSLLTAPVAAQLDDPRTSAPIHAGPFYVTPVLAVTNLGVDTNVFSTSEGQQSDFTFVAGPRVDVSVPLRRFVLTAETITDFVYYQQFANQRGVNFNMALRAEVVLPKVTLFVQDSFLNTRQRPNLEIDVRARREENVLNGGLSVDLSRTLQVEVAASHGIREYGGDDLVGASLARSLNRDMAGASGTVRYAVTPLTTIRVTSEMRVERFVFSPTRDNDSWSIVPGIAFDARALISGSAEVGYRNVHGVDDVLPDFRGPVASANLSYELLQSTNFGFTASRDIEFSREVLEPFYVSTGYGASVRHQFTAPFGISVGMQRFNLGYRQFGSDGGPDVADGRVDTVRRYTVTLLRRLSRSTEIGFELSHNSRRSSRVESRDFDGFLLGMTTAYAF